VQGVSHRAQVWVALWTVYIVWGSTYLGIELAGETIPGVFGAGVRFTIVGLIMFGIVLWHRGRRALSIGRAELASAALVGLLLPGANAVLFVTEQKVPIGLTSLIIASVPLWVLLLRLSVGERPDRVASLGLLVGFAGIAVTVALLAYAIPAILCGIGLLRFKRWARILGIVLAVVSLIRIPLGTLFGVYALIILFNRKTEALFGPPEEEALTL